MTSPHHTDSAEALHNDVEDGPDEFDPPGHQEPHSDGRVQVGTTHWPRDHDTGKHHQAEGEAVDLGEFV